MSQIMCVDSGIVSAGVIVGLGDEQLHVWEAVVFFVECGD